MRKWLHRPDAIHHIISWGRVRHNSAKNTHTHIYSIVAGDILSWNNAANKQSTTGLLFLEVTERLSPLMWVHSFHFKLYCPDFPRKIYIFTISKFFQTMKKCIKSKFNTGYNWRKQQKHTKLNVIFDRKHRSTPPYFYVDKKGINSFINGPIKMS
jgi:hypothetical protein